MHAIRVLRSSGAVRTPVRRLATTEGASLQKVFQKSVKPKHHEKVEHANVAARAASTASVEEPITQPNIVNSQPQMPTGGHREAILQQQSKYNQAQLQEFAPKIKVVGVGGAGGNAVNNMIARGLAGVEFLICNTDAQHLATSLAENKLQLGRGATQGLGCGANPDAGRIAAEESREEIAAAIGDANMVFITAGMGGGTGTGAAPVVAEVCMERGILTVGVVTKPFRFEGKHRMRLAEEGVRALQDRVDTLIVIPNQNLFQMVDQKTSLMEAFGIADDVLLAGVKSVTDLMVMPGLINLDFADVQAVMQGMGNAIMGTGQAQGEDRALRAADDALRNPLLGSVSIRSAKGMLINITGGSDLTLFEVDEAAQRITEELEHDNVNIIFGSAFDSALQGSIRVSLVATGLEFPPEAPAAAASRPNAH